MKMNGTQNRAQGSRNGVRGFTLVELLVVIAIIAILAGILLPTINGAIKRAEQARAQTEIQSLVTAVKAYLNEYGKFPENNGNSGDWNYGISAQDNKNLLNVLRDMDDAPNAGHVLNLRRIPFLEVEADSLDADGNMIDPWGQQYGITIDVDYDNQCEGVPVHGTIKNQTVIVWSQGLDAGNDADDIKSW